MHNVGVWLNPFMHILIRPLWKFPSLHDDPKSEHADGFVVTKAKADSYAYPRHDLVISRKFMYIYATNFSRNLNFIDRREAIIIMRC